MKIVTPFLVSVLVSMGASAAELKIHDDWVAAAPAVAKSQAAYICFINDSDKDVEITAVSARGFGKAMLHQTMQHGDMVMMHSMSSLVVPAHQMVTLEPGGMHIMLMEPEKIRVVGEVVPVTVYYRDGSEQVFNLKVKTSPEKLPDHQHP